MQYGWRQDHAAERDSKSGAGVEGALALEESLNAA
jgi:hypothetical protein